jgi:hypothetical protein
MTKKLNFSVVGVPVPEEPPLEVLVEPPFVLLVEDEPAVPP